MSWILGWDVYCNACSIKQIQYIYIYIYIYIYMQMLQEQNELKGEQIPELPHFF